ncbi:membrane fusion protein (MFP) family auxiliary transporter [Medicago truncatula]|uniref:Membrane fusion protein (MFP) family auxiliary transporter n=1 Tax=Medicago truncatula TaxID=3880 RepID=A0A072TNN0_MEDTR|nr:membrane fusion protein (MFP) family auxiliary transporter [Medicago truncatula]
MYVEAVNARRADLSLAQRAFAAPRALGTRLPVDENPAVVQAAAQFKLAYRNLKRTTIVAPVDGTIGQRSVQVGQQVGPGVPLMSIVQLNQLWIEANFKEGQIRHMRIGQPVEVVSDLYGSRVTYRGRVQGFSAGTGSAFSMLPSQNAAGNWIKVVQRVPGECFAAHWPQAIGLRVSDKPWRWYCIRCEMKQHDEAGSATEYDSPLACSLSRIRDGIEYGESDGRAELPSLSLADC